jgi:hypothetical protein
LHSLQRPSTIAGVSLVLRKLHHSSRLRYSIMAQPIASQTLLHVSLEPSDPPRLMPVSANLFSFGPPELKSSVRQPLSSSPSPTSSLYLAVRVRSLVNVLRKRVNRRSQTGRGKADDASFCRDIEREAYLEIDRYLGRKSRHNSAGKSGEGGKKAVGVQDDVTRVGAASSRERPKARRCVICRLESQLR